MRTRPVLVALAATLALTAVACGSDDPATSRTNPSTTPTTTAPAVSGATTATTDDIAVQTVPPTVDIAGITAPTTDIVTNPGGTDVPVSQPAADGEIGQIIGIEWTAVQRITVGGLQPLTEGASFVIDDAGRINVQTGCNAGSAAITGDGPNEFTMGPLATTKMACSDALNDLERYVVETMSGTVSWNLDGDTLKILPTTTTDIGLIFTRAAG